MKAAFFVSVILLTSMVGAAEPTVSFNRDVRPILSDRCFHCHGPNAHDRQAGLRLDQAEGPEGAYRTRDGSTAIKPGALEESAIWYRLNATDGNVMPPPDASKPPLTADEKEIIKRWIEEGASVEQVIENLREGNLEPEFSPHGIGEARRALRAQWRERAA